MRPEDFQEMASRLDDIAEVERSIASLHEERKKLPKKPPENISERGLFKAAAVSAGLGVLLLALAAGTKQEMIQLVVVVLCVISFLAMLLTGGIGLVLWRMRTRFEDGQIRLREIERSLSQHHASRDHLTDVSKRTFEYHHIPRRYQNKDALLSFEEYCYIDADMTIPKMCSRYEEERNIRELNKFIHTMTDQLEQMNGHLDQMRQNDAMVISLLKSIQSVGSDIDAKLDSIRKQG